MLNDKNYHIAKVYRAVIGNRFTTLDVPSVVKII